MFSDPKSHLPDKAVENYTWVAEEIPNLPTGQTQTWLLRLLIYYLRGMNHSLITASYRENYPDLAQSRDELEVQLEKLEIAIRSVDPGLATLQSGVGNFNIPNRSVLELLVHARYQGLPQHL